MNKIKQFFLIIDKLNDILSNEQKKKSIRVFFYIMISSFLELLSVSVVLPFVYAILEPQKVIENKYVKALSGFWGLNITSTDKMIYFMAAGICFVFAIRSAMLIFANYKRLAYENDIMKGVTDLMLDSYMCRPYEEMVYVNSAEALRGTATSATSVYYILQSFFQIFSNILTIFLIFILMIFIDAKMVLELMILSFIMIGSFLLATQKNVRKSGMDFNKANLYVNQYVAEAFHGMKEITVLKRKKYFLEKFENITSYKRGAELRFRFTQCYPSVLIQTIFICIVIVVVCVELNFGTSSEKMLPSLATFAYGATRILPGVSGIISSISSILYYYDSFNDAHKNISEANRYRKNKKKILKEDENAQNAEPIDFTKLEIRDLTWRYSNGKENVLEKLSVTIKKGESIGLIGKSGAGKSTLADIILGLLKPEKAGSVKADDIDIFTVPQSWSRTVGYVPQSVFLMDDSIKNNILFGAADTKENEMKVWNALEKAQLKEFVEELPDKLDTVIGEGGSNLSGGQRQRIAIARALFNDPEILILDEATSALDNETEKAVMQAIDFLQGKKTLIIIAHRLTTIENCDKIYEIVEGKAVRKRL